MRQHLRTRCCMSSLSVIRRQCRPVVVRCLALVGFLAIGSGCGRADTGELVSASIIQVDVDNDDPERLVRFYLGGYLGADGGDPFDRGLVVARDGRIYLNLDSLHQRFAPSVSSLQDVNGDNRLDWDELKPFLQATYYAARGLPQTLDAFRTRASYRDSAEAWFAVEVNGPMTAARRRVHVPVRALRAALRNYWINEEAVIYPIGTTIVGEHFIDGRLRETTAMLKRADGFWDFVTYDEAGEAAQATSTPPRSLNTPTQCVGCHFGSKLFEPEASFPREAEPSPHGPRAVHVDRQLRDAEVTAFFQEHERRSDTVLGLYSTLFVAQLRAERRAGRITTEDAALLQSLSL